MALVPQITGTCEINLEVSLTPLGKTLFFEGNGNFNDVNKKIIATKFGLSDLDVNYAATASTTNPSNTGYENSDSILSNCLRFTPTLYKKRNGVSILDNLEDCNPLCLIPTNFEFDRSLSLNYGVERGRPEFISFDYNFHSNQYRFMESDTTISIWYKGLELVEGESQMFINQFDISNRNGWFVNFYKEGEKKLMNFNVSLGTNLNVYGLNLENLNSSGRNNLTIVKKSNSFFFYHNGTKLNPSLLVSTFASKNINNISFDANVNIGFDEANASFYVSDKDYTFINFKGFVDEFFIKNKALTTREISNYYNDGNGDYVSDYNSLELYCRFNSISGTSAIDESRFQNNGSLNGYDSQRTTVISGELFAPAWSDESDCFYGCYFSHSGTNYLVSTGSTSTYNLLGNNFTSPTNYSRYLRSITSTTINQSQTVGLSKDDYEGYTIQFWLNIKNLPYLTCYPIISNLSLSAFTSNTIFNIQSLSSTTINNELNGMSLYAVRKEPNLNTLDTTITASCYQLGFYIPFNSGNLSLSDGNIISTATTYDYVTNRSNSGATRNAFRLQSYEFPQYKFDFNKWYHITLRFARNYYNVLDAQFDNNFVTTYNAVEFSNMVAPVKRFTGTTFQTTTGLTPTIVEYGSDTYGMRLFVNGEQKYYEGLAKNASYVDNVFYSSFPLNTRNTVGHIHAPINLNYDSTLDRWSNLGVSGMTNQMRIINPNYTSSGTSAMTIAQFYSTHSHYGYSPYKNFLSPNQMFDTLFTLSAKTGVTQIDIDEFKVYSKPISNREINDSYNCTFNTNSLYTYLNFNQQTGLSTLDSSFNNNGMLLSGSTGVDWLCER